jgi:hypothetical protein
MWLHYYNPQWIVYLNITGLLVFFVICVYKQLCTTPQPSPIIVFSLDSYFSESDSSKKRDVIFGVCVYFSCCFTVDYLFTFCIIILGMNKIEKFNFCLYLHSFFFQIHWLELQIENNLQQKSFTNSKGLSSSSGIRRNDNQTWLYGISNM